MLTLGQRPQVESHNACLMAADDIGNGAAAAAAAATGSPGDFVMSSELALPGGMGAGMSMFPPLAVTSAGFADFVMPSPPAPPSSATAAAPSADMDS